ncbi:hypothetical protein TH53_05685 [Pedobacter lusitanus]|uniref:Uncharacterized protein n=1 Tax=Pedobacter lusitanus TaxID=1503925 RepID=A0A0D0F8M7_9SPHI|nr:lantibiotic dehydratase [Pedobacter lusitanus]KIO78083.1 hypothetical protein TH53_05685 [Pedobacter lusitanus]
MSEFIVAPFLLVRSPAYSYENFNEQYLQQVLKTDFFRAGLYFASQTLYSELQKKDFDYEQLNQHVRVTLWKYLNRMCFRALPYGLFSSFSLAKWTSRQYNKLSFTGAGRLTALPDFVTVLDYIKTLKTGGLPSIKYYTNNSMYSVAGELYFVSQAYAEQNKHVIVHLKVVPGLKKLLKFIDQGQTRDAILNYLMEQYGEEAGIEDYFNHLVQGQVIVPELMPNITGMLYNERCLGLLKEYPQLNLNGLRTFSIPVNAQNDSLPVLSAHIQDLIGRDEGRVPYSLYQREITGGLTNQVHAEFIKLIKNLDKMIPDRSDELMKKFKEAFRKKYDRQEVSLMEVMDPGTGIGYENLASAFDHQDDGFINDLSRNKEPETRVNWGEAEKMIFKKWNRLSRSGSEKIILTQEDIDLLPESKSLMPPGMYILYKNVDRELWIDHIGGVSGMELGTRFGVSYTAIEDQLKKICEQEMSVNDDFIFAEIAFSPANKTSNIKQRGHFYSYEIPILTHSMYPDKNTIKLSDLAISMSGNTILLRSVKLNKYIIPRLSSAYNTQLTTIPAFRFLCDLQYQGTKSSLTFSLEHFFPGLDFYPRVQLDRTVLSPAKWILDENKIQRIVDGHFDEFKEEHQLPAYFSLNEGDNFLVFNSNNLNDIDIFRKCIKNKESITLKEYIIPSHADLYDAEKRPYMSQHIACVVNKSKSYAIPQPTSAIIGNMKKLKVKRAFLPGGEWLYIKVYAYNSLTDDILLNVVLPVLEKYKKNDSGFKWFFIRYKDTGNHLRLRFFTTNGSAHHLLAELHEKLKPLHNSGKISEILLDTYQRELERYSAELIDEVESLFYLDSEYILNSIRIGGTGTRFKLSFAVHSSLLIIKCFINDQKQRSEFMNIVLAAFSAEFNHTGKEISHKMDLKYRNFQPELIKSGQSSGLKDNRVYPHFNQLLDSLKEKISSWKHTDKHDFIVSLLHMHMNRIFESCPREYEFLAYHFMKKHQTYLNYMTNDGF